jgi:hypothetical protein
MRGTYRTTLSGIGIEKILRRPPLDGSGELQTKINRFANASIQPLPSKRRMFIRRLDGQQYTRPNDIRCSATHDIKRRSLR